jgi:hypothetical protein
MLESSDKKEASTMHYLLVGASALLLLLSNFSPWLSVAGIASVSGANTNFGIVIFITVVLLAFYVATGVAKDSGLLKYLKIIKILSIASTTVSLACLIYFIIRLASIKEKYFPNQNVSTDLGDLGEFGETLQESLDSLTQALTPRLGSGLYLAFISLIAVLGLILSKLPKNQSIETEEID